MLYFSFWKESKMLDRVFEVWVNSNNAFLFCVSLNAMQADKFFFFSLSDTTMIHFRKVLKEFCFEISYHFYWGWENKKNYSKHHLISFDVEKILWKNCRIVQLSSGTASFQFGKPDVEKKVEAGWDSWFMMATRDFQVDILGRNCLCSPAKSQQTANTHTRTFCPALSIP